MRLNEAIILISVTVAFLWSCGATDIFSKKESREVFYAAEDGLKVYPEPHFSQKIIAELPLNDKVLRYRTEKGFAYIRVERTGQEGWVDNARLKWRIEKKETAPETAPQEKKPEALSDQPSTDQPDNDKMDVNVSSPREAEETTPSKKSTSPDTAPKKPDASILDSY